MQIQNLYQLYLTSSGVTTDTRNIPVGSIFFALKGEKFDANKFAAEALEKGAAYAVVDAVMADDWKAKWGAQLIEVKDVLLTLQRLAGYHRLQLECPVLAITGSNGKTTTKELVAGVLSKKFRTYATKGNLNNHIGIPLTLLAIMGDVEFAVVEMGANHQGEIASYCEYVNPDFGIITNIGSAHLEGFGGIEGVLKGKTELYLDIAERDGKVFVNRDSEVLWRKAMELFEEDTGRTITYGTQASAFCTGAIIAGGEFLAVESEGVKIQTNLVGDYNFENVLSAVCIGKYFGVSIADIKEAIESYVPSNNRSQKVEHSGATIILDAYNANPSSMAGALRNFDKAEAANKVAVIGQMMELGEYSRTEHEKIAEEVLQMKLDKRIFVGEGFAFMKDKPEAQWFETTRELHEWFQQQNWQGALILIKGSRKNELEKILK